MSHAAETSRGFARGASRAVVALTAAATLISGAARADVGTGPLPVPTSGECPEALASFDRMMVRFLRDHELPGAALAVTDGGRLVLARGYGWADREMRQPVEPTSLFRIASLSKPITAVAVLRLVERGKLRLEDHFWDLLQPRPLVEPGAELDERQKRITIQELLQHTGGFDRSQSFDPMFRGRKIAMTAGVAPPAAPETIIRYMTGRRLDFDPGARYAYSNYGYSILGRLIESASGQSYEDHVREQVLAPLGISRMRIGGTFAPQRAPGEVRYYVRGDVTGESVRGPPGTRVPVQYGAWSVEAFDAHGGWIGSAIDLVRFASAFDDPSHCPILKEDSVRQMFRRPPGQAGHDESGVPLDHFYGCGWMVRPREDTARNTWHSGSIPGTAALLVRRHDGRCWAVLFNCKTSARGGFVGSLVDPELHRAANEVRQWPQDDLFSRWLR